ncbi:MAG: hypothetical protein LIP04_15990 [Tannerellaceae bacterium]|nr:hypothetical protein [Tannerellaceae bacterium]
MKKASLSQNIARISLGAFLTFAGISHLTFARKGFQAQVPDWVPLNKDLTVLLSGGVEISLGLALMLMSKEKNGSVHWLQHFSQRFFRVTYPSILIIEVPLG